MYSNPAVVAVTASQPQLLSQVSNPLPLYPMVATTITTMENPMALMDSLVHSGNFASHPLSWSPAHRRYTAANTTAAALCQEHVPSWWPASCHC